MDLLFSINLAHMQILLPPEKKYSWDTAKVQTGKDKHKYFGKTFATQCVVSNEIIS